MFGVDDAALIGGAATVIGAGTSAVGQATMNKATRDFNREEAEKQRAWSEQMYNAQNAWNYQMWNEQNEYNTPAAQVARLREAGLNPLYYGLDGSSAQSAQPAAQPLGYDRAAVGAFQNPLQGAQDVGLKIAQIANIQADTAKKEKETLTEVQRREKLIADIANAKQENNNLLAQEGLTQAQRIQIEKNNFWLDKINEAVLAEKESSAALNEAQRNRIDQLLEGEKILQAKSAQDFDEKWKKIRAEIGKIAKETGLLEKDIENYALNHANNGFMGTGLSLNNLFRVVGSAGDVKSGEENKFSEGSNWQDIARSGQ